MRLGCTKIQMARLQNVRRVRVVKTYSKLGSKSLGDARIGCTIMGESRLYIQGFIEFMLYRVT